MGSIGHRIFGVIFFISFGLNAQNFIYLKSEKVNAFSLSELTGKINPGASHLILQFNTLPDIEVKKSLGKIGVSVEDYIPEMAFIAAVDSGLSLDTNQLKNLGVSGFYLFESHHRLAESLWGDTYPAWIYNGRNILLNVRLYKSADLETFKANYPWINIKPLGSNQRSISIEISLSRFNELKSLSEIQFIEPIVSPDEPELYKTVSNHRANVLKSNQLNFDGSGVILQVGDTDYFWDHIDFKGRADIWGTYLDSDHGTHCGGIAGGAGNLDPRMEGHASGADLISIDGSGTSLSATTIGNNYAAGMRVTSHSLGWTCNGGYDANAAKADDQINDYVSLNHVFSAGNSGADNCGQYPTGWGNITGGYKQGKNVYAVANLYYYDDLRSSSSRGPATDGRIKPDISAVGSSVNSTTINNGYTSKSGTSMACPGVAGTLTQLIQGYRSVNSGADPANGLLRCIVLNTATDLGNEGPDFKYGWGKINALKAYTMMEDHRYVSGSISNGQNLSHSITVPAGVKELKVMVYWNDPSASTSASKYLVNDIDAVITQNAATYQPWELAVSEVDANVLDAPATKGSDHTNNMEQIVIADPTGTYSIDLNGYLIPDGPQEYFITYEYIMDDITVVYPIGGEGFVPGETERIRWDAFGETGNFTLEYSTDGGSSWSTISSSVSGDRRYYSWGVPSTVTGDARVRVSRSGKSDMSDEDFAIINDPSNLDVDWICDNMFQASWNAVTGAENYTVYKLGEKAMEEVITTSNLNAIIPSAPNTDEYYSVCANLSGNKGRRAIAEVKSGASFGCVGGKDLSVKSISENGSSTCYAVGSTVDIVADIENTGTETSGSFNLSYQVNGGDVNTELVSSSILESGILNYTFNEQFDVAVAGTQTVKVWLEITGDIIPSNDTLTFEFSVDLPNTFPIVEDFEDESVCGTGTDCEATSCPLNDWTNLENEVDDDIDWRVNSGSTVSSTTGPTNDHTSGNGNYIYLETSSCFGKVAQMKSPCLTQTTELSFWYHMYGSDMGTLSVDIIRNGSTISDVWTLTSDQGDQWVKATVDLSAYFDDIIYIVFKGTSGANYRSDIAIDDIQIEGGIQPTIIASKQSILDCENVSVSTDFTLGSVYSWDFGNGASPATANGIGPHDVKYLSTGNKSISLTIDGVTADSVDFINVNKDQTIVPTISLVNNNAFPICAGNEVDIDVQITNGGNSPTITWYVDNGVQFVGSNLIDNTINDGDEIFAVLNSNIECVSVNDVHSDTIVADIDICTSQDEVKKELTVLPNPTSHFLSIRGDFVQWELVSLEGKKVALGEQKTIDMSAFAVGIYSLNIQTATGVKVLLVEKVK